MRPAGRTVAAALPAEPSAVDALVVERGEEHVPAAGLRLGRGTAHGEAGGPDPRPVGGEEHVALGERVGAVILRRAELPSPLTCQAGGVLEENCVELADVRLEVAVAEPGHVGVAGFVESDACALVVPDRPELVAQRRGTGGVEAGDDDVLVAGEWGEEAPSRVAGHGGVAGRVRGDAPQLVVGCRPDLGGDRKSVV